MVFLTLSRPGRQSVLKNLSPARVQVCSKTAHFWLRTASFVPKQGQEPSQGSRSVLKTAHSWSRTASFASKQGQGAQPPIPVSSTANSQSSSLQYSQQPIFQSPVQPIFQPASIPDCWLLVADLGPPINNGRVNPWPHQAQKAVRKASQKVTRSLSDVSFGMQQST